MKVWRKIFANRGVPSGVNQTPGVSWLMVLLGGGLVVGNTVELGGVQPAAREWSAWMLAGLALAHGVGLAWRWNADVPELRLPRWPLWAAIFVGLLGWAAWRDQTNPELSRQTFFLAAQAWLLCWVVAASPGGRALSWAWLMVVIAAAALAMLVAVGWQTPAHSLWLPMGRHLPAEWAGHWSGPLPLPAAFGSLMLLAGAPLLVMACSRHLPASWRMLSGTGGLVMMLGALLSFSLGAWLGVAYILILLPLVVSGARGPRLAGWGVALALLVGAAYWLRHAQAPGESWLAPLLKDETPFAATRAALAEAWRHDLWLGGHGATVTDLAQASGESQPEGGWSFAFSDWLELAVAWGILGLGTAAVMIGALLGSAWSSWARLPFLMSAEGTESDDNGVSSGAPAKNIYYTPEAKVLLAAGALGLSALVVSMTASRALNLPAVVFAAAIVAGVLARNIPQRGGSHRLDPASRLAVSLGLAAITAILLVGKVAPTYVAQDKLEKAQALLAQIDQRPNAELMAQAEVALREVLASNTANASALIGLGWLNLERARLDPEQFTRYSVLAENDALRAAEYAPNAPEPWLVRGLACLLANRAADACQHLRQALALAPRNPQAEYYANTVLLTETSAKNGPPLLRMLPPRYLPPPPRPPLDGEPPDVSDSVRP